MARRIHHDECSCPECVGLGPDAFLWTIVSFVITMSIVIAVIAVVPFGR